MWKLFSSRKRVEKLKDNFQRKVSNQLHDLVEKFICNFDEGNCMSEKCSLCKSSETNDVMKLDFASDTDSGSETDSRIPR